MTSDWKTQVPDDVHLGDETHVSAHNDTFAVLREIRTKADAGDFAQGALPLTGGTVTGRLAVHGTDAADVLTVKGDKSGGGFRVNRNGNPIADDGLYALNLFQVGGTSGGNYGNASGIIVIHDTGKLPTAPRDGVILFAEDGALKCRHPDGTTTTIAAPPGEATNTPYDNSSTNDN